MNTLNLNKIKGSIDLKSKSIKCLDIPINATNKSKKSNTVIMNFSILSTMEIAVVFILQFLYHE